MEGLASSEDFLFLMSYVGGGETWQKKEERTRESQNPLLQRHQFTAENGTSMDETPPPPGNTITMAVRLQHEFGSNKPRNWVREMEMPINSVL